MTLEHQILQRLAAGPVPSSDLSNIDADDLHLTLKFMVERRQVCVQNGQVALFWHRHMMMPLMTNRHDRPFLAAI